MIRTSRVLFAVAALLIGAGSLLALLHSFAYPLAIALGGLFAVGGVVGLALERRR